METVPKRNQSQDDKSSTTGDGGDEGRTDRCSEQSAVVTTTTSGAQENIDAFISYQWDSQDTVRQLYKGLTGKGLHCWMDEKKIEGGGNLYGEIVRGLNNCRVVLSCVTGKYLESLSCRREVTLADQKNKLIIPVLLEEMKWPGEGPLSYIFSEIVYVDISSGLEELEAFKGPNINRLLRALKTQFPAIDDSCQEVVSSTTYVAPQITESDYGASIRSDTDTTESPSPCLDESPRLDRTDCPSKTDQATEISGTDVVRLLVFYDAKEFTPRLSPAITSSGSSKWCCGSQVLSFIRCQGVGVAGWTPYSEIRAALKPLFEDGARISRISQRRGQVMGVDVVEVTSANDEFPAESKEREFCDVDGKSYSNARARAMVMCSRPEGRVFISGGQRRTTLCINST